MSKVIVFDIGNSDVVVGFFDANILKCSLRIKSLKNENALFFEYRILNFMLEKGISKTDYTKGVVSSVVPSLTPYFVEFCNKFLDFDPILVNPGTSKLMKINIDNPEELGADLFVNALAAYSIYQKGCIVVDFGTALTFTSVNSKGEILGVNIVPGIKTAIKSLFSDTSLLPQVKLEIPEKVIGKKSKKNMPYLFHSFFFYGVKNKFVLRGTQQLYNQCVHKDSPGGNVNPLIHEIGKGRT